ncbi:MAG: TonB-dependent receptor [Deltaproteobacteria bacterium]|nr:TonB-dependent receptor [Deltaproteobacteria bacterium]
MSCRRSIIVCAALLARSAAADPPADGETIIIIDNWSEREAARDRQRALDEAPFVTVVHPDEHPATASVADALGASVGAQTRSLGGLGAYESVSVRGASPGHTAVLIDGVPLARIAAVTTDLGKFALDSFGEVDLYRGAVPVELGGAGVGGAVNLVTRLGRGEHGERWRASLGAGSFGARHLRVHYGDDHGALRSSTTIGYQAATGDYTYFSDKGTPLNPRDDGYDVRRNNQFTQLDAASRVGTDTSAGGVRLAYKDQGLPGTIVTPALRASLSTLDVVGDVHVPHLMAYGLVERQALRDPAGELGLGVEDRRYLTLSGGATSTWQAAIDRHRLNGGVELRADRFRDADAAGTRASIVGDREGAAVMGSIDLVVDPDARIVVTPAVRLDVVRTLPTPEPEAPMPVASRWDTVPSPRLTARGAVTDDVSIKASAGWYVRLPTLVELFGNRGTVIGSPALRPERGPSLDAGVVWAPAKAIVEGDVVIDRVFVEAAGFGSRPRDTIALITSVGYVARAMNVAASEAYGGELVASARVAKTVTVTANYTRLVTEQHAMEVSFNNKELPRSPGHQVYARADVARTALGRRADVWADASFQSDSYLDQANLQLVPARLLVGTGARVELAAGLALALSVENVADTRIEMLPLNPAPRPDLTETPTALSDYAGFPLPGRSFYLALEWSH